MHIIEPVAGNLLGKFSRDFPPILTIDPGETVRYRTLDARWFLGKPPSPTEWGPRFEPREPGRDDGHCLSGPVAVRGAEPGMMLGIRLDRIVPGTWGWTAPWYRPADTGDEGEGAFMLWDLDAASMTGTNDHGHTVALEPFMGVMGVAPAEPGIHSTTPPRQVGGNIDCKALVEGSTLYLPVEVAGALFSIGDGHAAQGDGELGGTAIECPMEQVDVTFDLRVDLPVNTACANTPEGWLTFGFHEDLNIAVDDAIRAMLDLMTAHLGLSRLDALSLASVAVDLRITQIVNTTRGVHAVLPHRALK